jgi:hypothetical protein
VIRKCLLLTLCASLAPGVAFAEEDDFLADAVVESEEEKKPTQPLFLIPLQPVWKTIEPARIDEAVKNIAAELSESGGFEVEQYNPRLGSAAYEDPEPRLKQRWLKEIRMAENNTRKRRFSQAIKSAGRVVRQVMQNPEHLRDPSIYCRSMILVAEGELRRGRRNKTMSILDIVASSCAEIFDAKGAAELSDAFSDLLADAIAEVRRRSAGTLVVQADEPGAEVYLNGAKLGNAPLIIRNLPPSKHLLAVVKAGHKPFGKVVKVGSEEVRVQARLTKPLGGGAIGRVFTEMRDNRISPEAIKLAASLLSQHGGKATVALLGGIAKVEAVIKVSVIAVDRKGQAVRMKSMSIDEDFLGLAPEMLGFTEKLVNLSKSFVGTKVKGQTLVEGLKQPQQQAQPVKWASLALGGKRKSLAQQGNARGPLKRGRKAPTRRQARKPRMNLEEKGEQTNRRDEEDPQAVQAERVDRRAADRAARESRRAERPKDRPDPRRSRAKRSTRERAASEPAKRRKRSRSRSTGARAQIDEWGVGSKPRRLRKRSRSRVNWPLIAGASVVGAGVIGGGFALWYSLAATPSAVNASVSWSIPE